MTKIKLEISNDPDPEWNHRMISSGFGTIYQSQERASFLEYENVPNYFLKFLLPNGKIVAQLLVSERERFSNDNLKAKFFKNFPLIKQKSFEWSYGPIIFDSNYISEVYDTLEKFLLSKNFKANGWTHPLVSLQPNITKNFEIRKWGTFLVDLSKSKDEVYNNIQKHSGRKNIERSINRGVEIKQINNESIKDYYDLVRKSKNDSARTTADYEIFERRWNTFQTLGFSGFLALKENIPIGGLLFTHVNGHIIEIGVARSETDTKNKFYSQDLIKWKIMEWGIKNKMKYYDLSGFNPEPISSKEEGIIKYKKKWGGKPYYYSRIISKKNPLRR